VELDCSLVVQNDTIMFIVSLTNKTERQLSIPVGSYTLYLQSNCACFDNFGIFIDSGFTNRMMDINAKETVKLVFKIPVSKTLKPGNNDYLILYTSVNPSVNIRYYAVSDKFSIYNRSVSYKHF
jgi:hypothetical protein